MVDELYRFDGQDKLEKINIIGKQYSYSISVNEDGYLFLETNNPRITADSIYVSDDGQLVLDLSVM